ncbi:MAG: hypothetical protein RBR51_02810 [Candidatus Cloacimonadaceae bacterium]|nr:hypothetical protein [Candidatus Cloacimonadaceae bacterium]
MALFSAECPITQLEESHFTFSAMLGQKVALPYLKAQLYLVR